MCGDHRCRIAAVEAASQRLRDCLDAGFRPLGGEPAALRYPAAISFLVPPDIASVMLIAAQGGQAMFVEVSVMERGNLGSPQAAAPVLRSAPEAGSSKRRDLPGW